jgi:hypothetical protein
MACMVDDVDMDARLVHARDRTGSRIQVSFRDQPGGITLVPSPGERWIAVRKGYSWFLDKRMDSAEEHEELAGYAPGDMRIMADGAVRIIGDSLTFNGLPVGSPPLVDVFEDPVLGFDAVTLSESALEDSIQVYINGLLIPASIYTFDGTTGITFDDTMGDAGFLQVVYRPA